MKTKSKTSVRAGKSPKGEPASPVATKNLDAARAAALAKLTAPDHPPAPTQVTVPVGDNGDEATTAAAPAKKAKAAKATKQAKPAKEPKAAKTPKAPKEKKPRKVSALDAAATVLADSPTPLRAIDMIAEMSKRGLWSSPGGKTPEATLYAAIIREIAAKGAAARFAKKDRGLFVTSGGGK